MQTSGMAPNLSGGHQKAVIAPLRAKVGAALKAYRKGEHSAADRRQAVDEARGEDDGSHAPGLSGGTTKRHPVPAGYNVRKGLARMKAGRR